MGHDRDGDPARVMQLLWGTRPAGRPGRRPALDVDDVVAAAVALADAEGIGALSMRRVAERLGTAPMSLYRYVPGKGELLEVMLDRVSGETERPDVPPGGPGAAWRPRLEQVARANRDLYRRHPWLLQVATGRPPLGPNVMAKYEYELAAVDGIGLTDPEMDSVLTLVLGYVHGAVRRDLETVQTEQRTGLTDDQWWAAYAPLLAEVFDETRWPLAARVGAAAAEAYGGLLDPDHTFEFGLARVLDGVAVLVDAAGSRRPGPDRPGR